MADAMNALLTLAAADASAAAAAAAPSRFAVYRKRKQLLQQHPQLQPLSHNPLSAAGVAIRSRLTAAQLDVIEAKAPEERSPAENRALRDRRKNRKRKCERTHDQQTEEDCTAADASAEAASVAFPPPVPHVPVQSDATNAPALPSTIPPGQEEDCSAAYDFEGL